MQAFDPLSNSAGSNGWLDVRLDQYEAQLATVQFMEDIWFWEECARRFGQPVLCLCCGTGREVLALASKGLRVVGIDVNPSFVAFAQQKLGESAGGDVLPASFVCADIVSMRLEREFPFAFMATQSFELLLTEADQLTFLDSLRSLLTDRGVFTFNISRVQERSGRIVDRSGTVVAKNGWTVSPDDRHILISPGGHMRLRKSPWRDLQRVLESAGFEIQETFGLAERAKPVTNSDDAYTLITTKR